jgi:hypothetical protein
MTLNRDKRFFEKLKKLKNSLSFPNLTKPNLFSLDVQHDTNLENLERRNQVGG